MRVADVDLRVTTKIVQEYSWKHRQQIILVAGTIFEQRSRRAADEGFTYNLFYFVHVSLFQKLSVATAHMTETSGALCIDRMRQGRLLNSRRQFVFCEDGRRR